MNNKKYKLELYKTSGEYMGELDVFGLTVSFTRDGFSNISFNIPAKIDNETNKRLFDVYDSYEVVLSIRKKKYRFTITETPAEMDSSGAIYYRYTAISLETELQKKQINSWEGIKKFTYWRRVDYKYPNDPFLPSIKVETNFDADDAAENLSIEIYEVRQTDDQKRESLLANMTGMPGDLKRGEYKVIKENGKNYILISPWDDDDKKSVPAITEIFYKIFDSINNDGKDIEYNQLLNKFQFNNADFYSIPTGELKSINGFLYNEEEFYSDIGVRIKDVVDGTIHKKTDWKVMVDSKIANEKRSNLEINNINCYELIEKIASEFDVVFDVDSYNKIITFYKEYSDMENSVQNNLVIDYQTYMKSIRKEITSTDIITNIIPIGSNNIDISLVSPTGNSWENYEYYLDDFVGDSSNTNYNIIRSIDEIDFINTRDYSTRWLSFSTAQKLGRWSFIKDYYFKILTGSINPLEIKNSNNDIKYFKLYEKREKLLKELVMQETNADTFYAQELHYKNLMTIIQNKENFSADDLDPSSPNYKNYLKNKYDYDRYSEISNTNRRSKENAEKVIRKLEHLLFGFDYDEDLSDSVYNIFLLMKNLKDRLDKSTGIISFSEKELSEIEKIKKDGIWNDDTIDNEIDLFIAADKYLSENNKPNVTIDIDVIDILSAAEIDFDKDNLFLGNYIYVRFEEFNIDQKAQISGIDIDFDSNSVSMTITTLKSFSRGISNKIIKKIRDLDLNRKNLIEYYKDYNKRAAEESKNISEIFGDNYNVNTNSISAGGVSHNENGEIVSDIEIDGSGIITSTMSIDAATDNIIVEKGGDTTIEIKDGSIGLVGHGQKDDGVVKTRIQMSVKDGFRIDVLDDTWNPITKPFKIVDNRFWAKMNGDLFLKGEVSAASGDIGGWIIGDNKIYSKIDSSSSSEEIIVLNSKKINGEYGIWAGSEDPKLAKFSVDYKGAIKAKSGTIGGWQFNDVQLWSGSGANYVALSNGDIPIFAGDIKPEDAKFSVSKNGYLKSESGQIGGWNISKSQLSSGSAGTYIGISSSPLSSYAIWAGNPVPSNGNFFLKNDGTISAQAGQIGDLYINTLSNIRNINSGKTGSNRRGLGFNTSYSYGGGTLKYFAGLDAVNLMLERESNDEGRVSTHLSYYGISVGRGAGSDMTPRMSMDLWGLRSTGLMEFRSSGNINLKAKEQLILSTSNKGEIFLSNNDGKELTILRNPNAVAGWTGFSTKTIKKDIENLESNKALEFINNIKIYEFNYSNSNKKGISFLIEDELLHNNKEINDILFGREYNSNIYIKEFLPEWLKNKIGTEDLTEYDEHHYSFNPLTFDFTTLNGLLIASVKELSKRVKELESKLNI